MATQKSTQHTPVPWASLTQAERDRAYQDASLRINDIEWYRFHGVDPRDTMRPCQKCAAPFWAECEHSAKATGSTS